MARRGWMTALTLALMLAAAPVFAQSTSAALSGSVTDKDGNVPGATVTVKNINTGETYPAQVTGASGQYSFPGLAPGTYKVTITMTGFKTVEIETRLASGSSNTLPPTKLEVGQRTEIVNVAGSSELVRTDTPTVSQTINSDFISTLPKQDRNALNFLIFLPGVQMTGGQRDTGANSQDGARFNTTIGGLSTTNITIKIDGVTTSSLLDNQGMFAMITPRLDAVEEVSLTTASAGADASGQGAIQVAIATRSGTNKFETSIYWYQQHAMFNSNTYFGRLAGQPVPQATNYTYGGRIGGPIILPGFDGRGKAFFFFNQEELYNPFQAQRSSTLIRQSALDGNWTYGAAGAQQTVNVLALAAANGQISAYDPQIKALLESMRKASTDYPGATITELVGSPNTGTITWLANTRTINHAPTASVTLNLSPKHRLQGSYYWIRFLREPDNLNSGFPTYPDFPAFGNAEQYRTLGSASLRSTVSSTIVNEARGGWQWAPVGFSTNGNAAQFENQGGFNLTNGNCSLAGLVTCANNSSASAPFIRNTMNFNVSDQLNWLKGSHSMTFGADYTHVNDYNTATTVAPAMAIGFLASQEPAADAMFSAANFPGSVSGDRNNAKALYALLTGRVSSISGTGRMNDAGDAYVYNGDLTRRETQDDYSFYAQDTWRWKPTVTITAGLRYQFTLPITSAVGNFTAMTMTDACGPSGEGEGPGGRLCNMFNGGNPTGPGLADIRNPNVVPMWYQYTSDTKGYSTDFNNVAPNVGISWRPNVQSGWLRKVLGDPELASFNGGWTRSFTRPTLDQFLNVYNGNPGQTIPLTRSTAAGAYPLVLPGEQYPILFSQKSRLGAPTFDPSPALPVVATFGGGAFVFDPDIQVPYVDSWNVAFQRSITKDTVVEIRYQGNRSWGSWTLENWNDNNVYETGWLTAKDGQGHAAVGEFELAQKNLRANVLAGRPEDGFRYTGIAGTSPLPIILAHFNASTNAGSPAAYTGNLWTNTRYVGALDPFAANPRQFSNDLWSRSESTVPTGLNQRLFENAKTVGYPVNFWVLNPLLNEVEIETNSTNRPMNHFVILQARRRLSAGLAVQASYTWARSFSGSLQDFHLDRFYLRSTGIPHAIQTVWTYDLPFGRGKKIGANMNPWLDGFVGGWTFSGTARFQRQSFVLRNAVLVGMSLDEARKALSVIRFVTDPVSGAQSVFNFPEDIYTNTRLAYATDETRPDFYAPGTRPDGPLATATADGKYRYFAPAGSAECSIIYPGDCGTQELWFNGRFFGEMDFRLAKQFQLPHRARFEFSAEVFNATKALNFPNVINPGTSGNTFRATTTQSGARTAQLVWRISF